MKFDLFVPRSNSKIVFATVITCYTWTMTSLMRLVVYLFTKPEPNGDGRATHTAAQWAMHFSEGLVLAPVLESLILIGMIELLRALKSSRSAQIFLSALAMGLLHSFSWHPRGLIIAPAFGIWAAAYLFIKDSSFRVMPAYGIIVLAHFLHSLMPALADIVYAM